MKIIVYGGQLRDTAQVKEFEKEYKNLKGTCYISDYCKKPNGIWKRYDKIDTDGIWFYKNRNRHTTYEIWKMVGKSDSVVLDNNIEEDTHDPDLFLNPEDEAEIMEYGIKFIDNKIVFILSEEHHPVAYKNKMTELIESGMSVSEARNYINTTPIDLEVYYEKNRGLFVVECAAIEEGNGIYSPYSKNRLREKTL